MNHSGERPSNRRFVRNCEYSNRPGGAGAQSEYLTSCRLTSQPAASIQDSAAGAAVDPRENQETVSSC